MSVRIHPYFSIDKPFVHLWPEILTFCNPTNLSLSLFPTNLTWVWILTIICTVKGCLLDEINVLESKMMLWWWGINKVNISTGKICHRPKQCYGQWSQMPCPCQTCHANTCLLYAGMFTNDAITNLHIWEVSEWEHKESIKNDKHPA